ncbi:fumarylacetoacetate hydrolase family protein [Microbacterium oleivorans]|uniref:2-keto-4-pentenoatehydratase/2-oxohepta-3-ene-1, 7-dioic acid hydratase n=1 Tax=Microbacterium oleivorans TaxID=273677 RepID=A0A031FM77_9MICO|nr:fumarylacetoacetate hydrolase family protein [Microbacterium oleivorans]AZS43343.1 Ureidoglycolate lyase [Microbacterium oleivorans]EZP25301.1 2-keto-4-pentenoatehydratase/2-oxohepta-3-ene-1, 7-dioic acid hydratase [Microbacterium oleivorans]THE06786.1 FAA hydrolase family protein [Microbacterium oleivorans]
MRFAHVVPDGVDEPQLVLVEGDRAAFVSRLFDGAPSRLQPLIEGGDALLDRVREGAATAEWMPVGTPVFASAILDTPITIAIGLNYSAHSSELGLKADAAPTVFILWPGSLSGHRQTTSWPRSLSQSVDYEAELGVIIGPAARDVALEDALDHVWGYTVVNDITARDIQFSEAQWSRCKSFDGFTPTGPFVVTADEIPDPQDLHIWAIVDGKMVQDASTDQMIHPVAKLVSFLSQSATLLPGTLISTGSPGGAGYSRDPQIFLRDRSTVTVGVDGIGELTTFCRITD